MCKIEYIHAIDIQSNKPKKLIEQIEVKQFSNWPLHCAYADWPWGTYVPICTPCSTSAFPHPTPSAPSPLSLRCKHSPSG